MPFVITGEINSGMKVFWRNWTGTSIKGRPTWVKKFHPNCLFMKEATAVKTSHGEGSGHWRTTFESVWDKIVANPTPVLNIKVEEFKVAPEEGS